MPRTTPSDFDDDEFNESLTDFDINEASPETNTPKRRGGRPKGATNKPKGSILTRNQLDVMYDRIKVFLPEDQKRYVEGIVVGKRGVEPMTEMKLLVRQCSLILTEASIWMFDNKRVTQDFAGFANTLRMCIKDLYDMEAKESLKADSKEEENDLVRVTDGRPEMERLETFLRDNP